MTVRSKAWIQTHLLSPRLGVYLVLFTPLLVWDRLFFGYASTKIFWVYAVVQITFVVYLLCAYKEPSLRRKTSWQTWVLFGFLVILVLSTLSGVYPANSFWADYSRNAGLLTWLHVALLFPVLRCCFQTQKDWQAVAKVSVFVGLLVSFIFFLTRWGVYTPSMSDNGGSTLGNSSYLGVYLLFQMFFALLIALVADKKRMRILGVGAFCMFVFTLFFTDARAAGVAFLGAVVLAMGLFLLTKRMHIQRVIGGFFVGLLFVGFVYVVVFAYMPESSLHQWVIDHATASRFVVADMAIEAFKERPLLGWGPENFSYAFLAHYDPCFGDVLCGGNTLFDRAHNIILDMLVQTGLLGLIGYLSVLATAVVSAWLAVKRRVLDLKVGIVFTATLAAYVVQNLTFLDELNTLLFLVILFAFPVAVLSKPAQRGAQPAGMVPALATVLLPIAFFLFVIQPVRAGLSVFTATQSTNSITRYAAYEIATGGSPFGRDVRREYLGFSTAKLLWSFHPQEDAQKLEVQSAYLQQEVALVENALYDTIEASPNNFRSYLYLAQLLQVHARLFDEGKFVQAMRVTNEAIERNPKFPRLYWVKVSMLLEQDQIELAREVAAEALALNTDSGRSWWNTFLFSTYIQDTTQQQEAIRRLTEQYPEFVGRIEEVLLRDLQASKIKMLYEFYSE